MSHKFTHAISIKPLGLMYASMGAFLSPQNLVGRSNTKFPPDSPTLSGIYASQYNQTEEGKKKLDNLQLAGSFWSEVGKEQDFYVPTPFNCLVEAGEIKDVITYQNKQWLLPNGSPLKQEYSKYNRYSWLRLSHWQDVQNLIDNYPPDGRIVETIKVKKDPWKPLPHLHPRLDKSQRIVAEDIEKDKGSLFLENAIQLPANICLIYLANLELEAGWYRFGGEGHLVEIKSHPLSETTTNLLHQPLGSSFALISPGVWGTNRQSHLQPVVLKQEKGKPHSLEGCWQVEARISDRPRPFRYRLGVKDKDKTQVDTSSKNAPKLLSRGRYAVPPGTVYVLEESLPPWHEWGEVQEKKIPQWFPEEGYSFKRWGCSFALPLSVVK